MNDRTQADLVGQTREWSERLKALPELIAYIVLDPELAPGQYEDRHDSQGWRYVLASSSILDECHHRERSGFDHLFGIPLYRRCDMPKGWPGDEQKRDTA